MVTVTATYEYVGGSQSKQFSLTIVREDLPPTFPANGPADGLWHGNDLYIDGCPKDPSTTVLQTSIGASDREGAVTYELTGDLPPGAEMNANGYLDYDLTTADAYKVYQFDLKATDTAGQYDIRHVVLGSTVQNQGWGRTQVAINTYANVAQDSTDNEIQLANDPTAMTTQYCNGVLNIVSGPSHGTLEIVPATATAAAYVRYTPTAGYHGLDSFQYNWTYQKLHYVNGVLVSFGTATTNTAVESIQVGDCVSLDLGSSELIVGGTTMATLTIQNPRLDGVPMASYWGLEFDRSRLRMFGLNGRELLPFIPGTWGSWNRPGSTFPTPFSPQTQSYRVYWVFQSIEETPSTPVTVYWFPRIPGPNPTSPWQPHPTPANPGTITVTSDPDPDPDPECNPKPDVNTDSNNDGDVVKSSDDPASNPSYEMDAPGKIIPKNGARTRATLAVSADSGLDSIQVKLSTTGSIQVYRTETGDDLIDLSTTTYTAANLPSEVWIAGTDTGTAYLSLTASSDTSHKSNCDTVRFTVASIDVAIDGIGEEAEDNSGAIVWRNSDFSKQNHDANGAIIPDYRKDAATDDYLFDGTHVSDLTQATVTWPSWMTRSYDIQLTFPGSILVWNNTAEVTRIESGSTIRPTSNHLNLYIEGINRSGSFASDAITVSAVLRSNNFTALSDTAKFTVVDINAGVDGNRDKAIDLANSDDHQLTFWYNNNHDTTVDGVQQDLFGGVADFADGHISNTRDLEDFSVYRLLADDFLNNVFDDLNGKVEYFICLTGNAGVELNLFHRCNSEFAADAYLHVDGADRYAASAASERLNAVQQVGDEYYSTAVVSVSGSDWVSMGVGDRSPIWAGVTTIRFCLRRSGRLRHPQRFGLR